MIALPPLPRKVCTGLARTKGLADTLTEGLAGELAKDWGLRRPISWLRPSRIQTGFYASRLFSSPLLKTM